MIKTYTHRHITWLDVEAPTPEDINSLVRAYKLHPLVGEELLGPSKSSKAAAYKDYVYLVMTFPARIKEGNHHRIKENEVDFIIGRDFIITTHYEVVQPIHAFAKAFEANSILDKEKTSEHAGHIFYYMMKRMYRHMSGDLDEIKNELVIAEEQIFAGKEIATVEVLSNLSRELLDFRQTCRSHLEILESLQKLPPDFFNLTFGPFVADIKEEFIIVRDLISNNRELCTELRETNDSLLTTKQNETIKILTVVTSVIFPLSLFTELFMMNTSHAPIVGRPYDFEIIVSIMVIMALCMFWFFKRKKWL
jgi:magnesium transporter